MEKAQWFKIGLEKNIKRHQMVKWDCTVVDLSCVMLGHLWSKIQDFVSRYFKKKIAKHIDIWIMFSDHQLIRSNVTISWSISLPFAKVLMKYNMFLLVPLKGFNRATFTVWISPYKWGDNGYNNMVLNFPKRRLKIYYKIPFNQFTVFVKFKKNHLQ